MKPRKPDESDAGYIARLEMAYADVSAVNKAMKKVRNRIMDAVIPAAAKTAEIAIYAAEVTGMKEDPEVKASIAGLGSLVDCLWHDDAITIPDFPKLPTAEPERFGGDAEMILMSAIERVKQTRPPWESWRDVLPEHKGVDPADLDWEGLADEVYDALANLEFSRGLLRNDLRSTMYDHCFERIRMALMNASVRVREDRAEELAERSIPF
ncbi:hypothetical protein GN330_22905 [Nitratireductor sp. CAU 1489]|uniref:Uncharacterized protein n=1 Tax=Nitratireductor arenosus TaxID=2682096 RepID=A0A844QR91_9HYPH|nr:hypothetical protein [Nitratireductor arenosus]MVB00100.1 hypothetical protein [Nitratireductor arenosus]